MGQIAYNMRGQIDWMNLLDVVKNCSDHARNRGHNLFGVFYYGECYTASNVDLTAETPVASIICDKYFVGDSFGVSVYKIIK